MTEVYLTQDEIPVFDIFYMGLAQIMHHPKNMPEPTMDPGFYGRCADSALLMIEVRRRVLSQRRPLFDGDTGGWKQA